MLDYPKLSNIPRCPACNDKPAAFFESSAWMYGGKNFGPVYLCRTCGASVGAKSDGTPLGRLGGSKTRRLRQKAHAAFDPLWQEKMARCAITKKEARSRAYVWLAQELGVEAEVCHIAMLSDDDLKRVVTICENTGYWKKRKDEAR